MEMTETIAPSRAGKHSAPEMYYCDVAAIQRQYRNRSLHRDHSVAGIIHVGT